MAKLNKNHIGLTVGIFFAIIHAVWALIIAITPSSVQKFLDLIFPMHFLNNVYSVTSFNISYAVLLIIFAFVGGYICGWVFAAISNWFAKKK